MVVLPRLLVVVTTFPPPRSPPEVPFVLPPEVPFVLPLLLPVPMGMDMDMVDEPETAVVPVRTVCATVVVPLALAALTSV